MTLYAVDAVPAEAYAYLGLTMDERQVAGPAMVEVLLIDANRQPVPDADIDRVIIAMPYDTANIAASDLLDGTVDIYKVEGPAPDGVSLRTEGLCDLIGGSVALGTVPTSQILDVSNGSVTFWVDSLSAFGIQSRWA